MFVYSFDKNYLGSRFKEECVPVKFENLFDMIKKQFEGSPEVIDGKLRLIMEWKVISNDNILKALLVHHFDELANEYMGFYYHFLDKELFVFCMTHGNTIFLRQALLLSAFDKMIFRE